MRFSVLVRVLPFLALLAAGSAEAHNKGQSYLYFSIYDDSVLVRVEITVGDLNRALGLTMPTGEDAADLAVEEGVAARLDTIRAYVEQHLDLDVGGAPVALEFLGHDVLRTGRAGDFVRLRYEFADLEAVPEAIDVRYTALFEVDDEHRNLVHVEHNWKTSTFNNESNVAFILSPDSQADVLDLSASSVWRGFIGMIEFGVEHILTGYDHILFLLALILPSVLYRRDDEWEAVGEFRGALIKIVAIVTFFTIAHSVTLSVAALGLVSLPSMLVESIIAASIAVAALHNLVPRFIKHEATIAFVFGLFHGFGFASLLEPLGLSGEYTALTLLGFNLGVEIGQIGVIALAFPVLYLIRERSWYKPVVLRLGSVLLILMALVWLVERISGSSIGWLFYLLRQEIGI